MKHWTIFAGIILATGLGVFAGELPESLKKTLDYTQKTNFFVVSSRFEDPVLYTDIYFRSVGDDGTIQGRCDHFAGSDYTGSDFYLPSGSYRDSPEGAVSDSAEENPVLSGKVFQTLTETLSTDAYTIEDKGPTRGRGVKSKLFLASAVDRNAAPDGVAEYRLLAGSDETKPFLYRIWKLDSNGNDIERVDLRGAVLGLLFSNDVFALPTPGTDMMAQAKKLQERYVPKQNAVDVKQAADSQIALQFFKDNMFELLISLIIIAGGIAFLSFRVKKSKKTTQNQQ